MLFRKSPSNIKLIEINRMQIEGIMTISGLLLKTERPEKNIPPQLTIVNSPPATAFVTPGMEWMSKNVTRLSLAGGL